MLASPRSPVAFDHLVVLARTLDEGTEYVAEALAVDPVDGGAHPGLGTHDRLVGIWGGVFIQIVAPDPDAPAPERPRWLGLDTPAVQWRLAAGPFLAHWAVRVLRPRSLVRWQQQYPRRLAPTVAVNHVRGGWRASVAADGGFPEWRGVGDGLLPTVVQFDTPAHPGAHLPHGELALTGLTARHPRAQHLVPQLRWMGAEHAVSLETTQGEPALMAHFETRYGPRVLK